MDFGRKQNQAFFKKLNSTKNPHNLSQIFEDDNKPLQNENKNLRYQPQSSHKPSEKEEQPRQETAMTRSERCSKRELTDGTWSTVIAVVAEGYKGNENIGRVGLALLRNDAGAAQLMVYKNKGKILSWLHLTKTKASSSPRVGRCTVIKREAYLQFFDEEKCFWSIHIVLEHDEAQFMQELTKIGLNLNERPPEVAAESATSAETPVRSNNEDSEGESIQSGEEIITSNHEPRPSMTMIKACKTVSLTGKPQATVSKLETYLEEQRAAGQSIEKKMDLILQTLCVLAKNSTSTLPHLKEGGDSAINSLLQTNMKLLQQCNDSEETSTLRSKISENEEDELLELEQKVLDYKKENRALMRSLKAKDQAIDDLRNSTGNLCDELVTRNNDLKQQNTSLIAAMAALNSASYESANGDNCRSCDHYLAKISILERRVIQLQTELLNVKTNEGIITAATAKSKPH